MYIFFNKLLFILGLRFPVKIDIKTYFKKNQDIEPDIEQNIEPDIEQNIENDGVSHRDLDKDLDISCFKMPKFSISKILYYIYSTIIFGIIIVEPIFLIVISIRMLTLNYISNIAFLLIPPVFQLIIIKYFRSKNFDKIYYEVSFLKDTRHLIKNDLILSLIILIPSIVSIIISVTLKFTIYHDNSFVEFYSDATTKTKIGLYIFQIISWFYSRTITFLSLVVFFYVFFKHINDIKTFIFVLSNNKVWTNDTTLISEFIHAIIKLRYELDKSIEKLSKVYIFSTILGAIGLGNIISNKKTDTFTIISSIIFTICQLVFLLVIYLITDQQSKLNDITMNPEFSVKYIYRKYKFIDYNISHKSPTLYKNIRRYSNIIDLSETSIGRLLKNVYSPQYKEATIKVIPLSNLQEMLKDNTPLPNNKKHKRRKKNKTSTSINIDNRNLDDFNTPDLRNPDLHNPDLRNPDLHNPDLRNPDLEKISPLTKDIIKTINNINNYNGSSIDYIILHLLISENWTSNFSLLGMQFNGTDSIQKALLITSVIITISGFLSELQVYL